MNLLMWIIYPSQRTCQPGEAEQAASPGADPVPSFPRVGSGTASRESLLRRRVAVPAPVLQLRPGLTEPQTNRSVGHRSFWFDLSLVWNWLNVIPLIVADWSFFGFSMLLRNCRLNVERHHKSIFASVWNSQCDQHGHLRLVAVNAWATRLCKLSCCMVRVVHQSIPPCLIYDVLWKHWLLACSEDIVCTPPCFSKMPCSSCPICGGLYHIVLLSA